MKLLIFIIQDNVIEEEIQFFSKSFKKEDLIDLNQNIKRTKYEIIRYKM